MQRHLAVCITPSATHHSTQSLRSPARSPVFCSFLFSYKGEFIHFFHTEVEKRSEESFFHTLQEQFQILIVSGVVQRLAGMCTAKYTGWSLEKPRAVSALGTKISRSQRQQQSCPYGARETSSRDVSPSPWTPQNDHTKFPLTSPPAKQVLYSQSRAVHTIWAGRVLTGLWGGGRASSVVSSETLSHPGQMESDTTALKSSPHYLLSQ